MKADKIIRNANVFTSAARDFHATAFAVKDDLCISADFIQIPASQFFSMKIEKSENKLVYLSAWVCIDIISNEINALLFAVTCNRYKFRCVFKYNAQTKMHV